MWFLIPVAAALGGAIWELVIRPEAKTEVVIYSKNPKAVNVADLALTGAGVDHEITTDGINSWIMVKPGDRAKAAQVIAAAKIVASDGQ